MPLLARRHWEIKLWGQCVCVQSLEDLDSSLQQGTQDEDELQEGPGWQNSFSKKVSTYFL